MKKNFILILSFVLLAFTACNSDDDAPVVNSIAFAATSVNLTAAATPIEIKFATPTAAAGTVTLSFVETDVVSGTDFTTLPAAAAKTVIVPFGQNVSSVSFTFNKLIDAVEGENKTKKVVFTIVSATINITIAENKSIQVNFTETASLGSALSPEVGGSLEPNQVYVDLSSGTMTKVVRTSWDLGFYSGDKFRVVLNSSLKMAAKLLPTSNIDEVQVADESMIISQGQGNATQIDDPTGDFTKTTAIAEVSATDSENKVYLINMGSNPSTTTPASGSEGSAGGTSRGWKKIRVLKSGNDYKVQYADIAATTHSEVIVSKNAAFNFTFFSLLDKKTVDVEPQKAQWDLNFTTFTNIIPGATPTPYYYPDFVLSNLKGGAKAYQVLTTAFTYDAFTLANVDNAKFTEDQRNIGSNWRSTSAVGADGIPVSQFVLKTDRFFVVKDPAGNIYKLKFTGGASATGERGFPKFQYAILK
ncbi:HmuY family protein [Flavobacterium panici]|uniref:HmuY protein n=1 Tax=Flavobacterium panici TaxID=2654843 RepID=A0A9N8J542_9FLAO|nr:HmuY family protein [Flavobacterium panici]CAC9976328.1 hypothetical protein FLAPXU55_04052 [Flavobacterium panici]